MIDRIRAGMGDMIIAADIVRQFPERGFLIYATCGTKKFLDGLGGRKDGGGQLLAWKAVMGCRWAVLVEKDYQT